MRDNFLVRISPVGARRLHILAETAPQRARPHGRMSRFSLHRGEDPAAVACALSSRPA